MNEYDKLLEERNELRKDIKALYRAKDILISEASKNEISNMISIVESKRELLYQKAEAIRKNCNHEWEDDGHNSHHDYEKCIHCGELRIKY